MFFQQHWESEYFFRKKTITAPSLPPPPPFKLNGSSLRQQLFFSLLDIPQTISLNPVMFGAVNLNDEENKAVFKSVQIFIIKSNRFTP